MHEFEKAADILYEEKDSIPKILYYAALILLSEMKEAQGLIDCPLDPQDVNNDKAKELIPAMLYKFVEWLTSSERKFSENIDFSDEFVSEQVKQTNRTNLSICQHLIFANSSGEIKMPEHVGLAFSVHYIWRAKDLVTILNRHGHCISYDALKRIDTAWAEMMGSVECNSYTVIPSNIVEGVFTQAAADNADFNGNNLDGKDSVHITSAMLYQEKAQLFLVIFIAILMQKE